MTEDVLSQNQRVDLNPPEYLHLQHSNFLNCDASREANVEHKVVRRVANVDRFADALAVPLERDGVFFEILRRAAQQREIDALCGQTRCCPRVETHQAARDHVSSAVGCIGAENAVRRRVVRIADAIAAFVGARSVSDRDDTDVDSEAAVWADSERALADAAIDARRQANERARDRIALLRCCEAVVGDIEVHEAAAGVEAS